MNAASRSDRNTLQTQVVAALAPLLPPHALLWQVEDTVPYECDGLTAYRQLPLVVALPETEAQVADVLAACHRLQVPVVARGAGTGLSGGALPHALGVTLSLAMMQRASCGLGTSLTVTSVVTASMPSLPTINGNKSRPGVSSASLPNSPASPAAV